ncbi:MAG: TolC family protein, partial [Bacteroidales bacterium]|nr:TolC family protein [Bacteroidales bacterium]
MKYRMNARLFWLALGLGLCANACGQTADAHKHYAPKYAYRVEAQTHDSANGGALQLSLDEAVDYALTHNKNLLQTKNDVLKAVYSKREAIANYLPQAKATVDFNTYFNGAMEMTMEMDSPFGKTFK